MKRTVVGGPSTAVSLGAIPLSTTTNKHNGLKKRKNNGYWRRRKRERNPAPELDAVEPPTSRHCSMNFDAMGACPSFIAAPNVRIADGAVV